MPSRGNNSATTAPATLGISADVSVTTSGPATITAGSGLSYTITVSNTGPSAASNISLSDAVPAGMTFLLDDANHWAFFQLHESVSRGHRNRCVHYRDTGLRIFGHVHLQRESERGNTARIGDPQHCCGLFHDS